MTRDFVADCAGSITVFVEPGARHWQGDPADALRRCGVDVPGETHVALEGDIMSGAGPGQRRRASGDRGDIVAATPAAVPLDAAAGTRCGSTVAAPAPYRAATVGWPPSSTTMHPPADTSDQGNAATVPRRGALL